MLRRNLDRRGVTVDITDSENLSDEDETDETAPLCSKRDSSKRKSDRRSSPIPRKKAKVIFISPEFRKHIDVCQPSIFLKKRRNLLYYNRD